MAITKADFLEIGRRCGVSDELATAAFEAYHDTAATTGSPGSSGVSDEAARKDIELLMQTIAANANASSTSREKRKGFITRLRRK